MPADPLSCKRYYAGLRREREKSRSLNPYATRLWVPFPEWLHHVKGVLDWHTLTRYELWDYYLDYRVDCVKHEMLYEDARKYGLDRV